MLPNVQKMSSSNELEYVTGIEQRVKSFKKDKNRTPKSGEGQTNGH